MENEKVTVYYNTGTGGMARVEGRLEKVTESSVFVVPKRARKSWWLPTLYYPYVLVVRGWGHPECPSSWEAPESLDGVTVTRGKYSACDPKVESDFRSSVQFAPEQVVVELCKSR